MVRVRLVILFGGESFSGSRDQHSFMPCAGIVEGRKTPNTLGKTLVL